MRGARHLNHWLAAAAVLLLAACETVPAPPLLSPLQTAKRYGYAERDLGDGKYEVTYVGPTRRVSRFSPEREADIAAARGQASDFMLWRAAQLAQMHGAPAFRVGQIRSDVDTYVQNYTDDPFWGSPFGPWYGPPYAPGHRFGYPFYQWPYAGPISTYAHLLPRVSADVTLHRTPEPGDYLAEEVIERLRKSYPEAEGQGFQAQ